MKCPKCESDNREGVKFCEDCGERLEFECPSCKAKIPLGKKFCGECGYNLKHAKEVSEHKSGTDTLSTRPSTKISSSDVDSIEGERKHVTVLFSDLIGYTTMSERLDPEEVREVTTHIVDEISKIISKYEGFIEKYAGDAVMALFGADASHEDDPVRAIKAAKEIHNLVDSLSPQFEERIKQPLSMHTGINTGLVVTGEIDLEKGTHGVAGDTVNVAARLSALGNAGEILVGRDTYYQSEGYFDFKALEPAAIKGKSTPIRVYRVLAQKEQPIKIHRLHGLKADLIGRTVEMNKLSDAVHKLKAGTGAVFSIYGTAGTGKSRLVHEFKASLNLKEIQWLEGHAYPHNQNIPYAPLINLLSRSLQIKEGDPSAEIRKKVEKALKNLIGENQDLIPYVGSLFSLSYPEIEEVSPEHWKAQLQKAIQTVLSALAESAPTIVCLEDLHWADPSFIELIKLVISEFRDPILFVCVYRPIISLFTSHQVKAMTSPYQEIRLQDLSPSESEGMVESLLKTKEIPNELQRFVQDKIEGNPFYIEEVINSLIESDMLMRDNGNWKLTRAITEAEVSSTIQGVISSRLDRLEKESKRILQEASVIGRTFFYEILNRITELKHQIDQSLRSLERLDLIRTRTLQPDLEFMFKHALTQEVVYNGLLKKERRAIHEKIALVMENIFQDRLPEFYETLAFHFKQGRSIFKAVDYLIRSGEKSLARYAVEESHQYFKEAFDLLSNKPQRTKDEDALIIELLIKWSSVRYYRGDLGKYIDLLIANRDLAESLVDRAKIGMFYAWCGWSLWFREKFKDSYEYLRKALEVGEQIKDQMVIGYACTWLTFTCTDLGALEEAIKYGEMAQKISKHIPSDQYLFFKSLAGIGFACFYKGNWKKALEAGTAVLDYGRRHSNIRSMAMGHFIMGLGYYSAGDFPSAIGACKKAVQTAQDPMYSQFSRFGLGMAYAQMGQFKEAEEELREVASYCKDFRCEVFGTPTQAILGLVSIAKGQMDQGLKMIEGALCAYHENQRRCTYASFEQTLGEVYLQIVDKSVKVSLTTLAKNVGFIIKNVPSAAKKAAEHFNKAITVAKEIGAKGIEGLAYLDLGRLHQAKGRSAQARDCFSKAARIFEEFELGIFLKQAKEALQSLG